MDWKRLFFGKGGSLTPTFDNLISKRADKVILTILGAFALLFNALVVYLVYTDEELSEIYSDNFILYIYTNALVVLVLYVVGVYLLWKTEREKLGFFCVAYFFLLGLLFDIINWLIRIFT
ncbi:MAG: hypothetical protein ACPG05_03830 [Bdellovibrionales bacterium]